MCFIAMLFLLTAFALESNCKSTHNNPSDQKYFHHVAENVYFCNLKNNYYASKDCQYQPSSAA